METAMCICICDSLTAVTYSTTFSQNNRRLHGMSMTGLILTFCGVTEFSAA